MIRLFKRGHPSLLLPLFPPPPDVQHNSRISGRPPAHLANGAPPPPSGPAARCAAASVALRLMGREMLLEEEGGGGKRRTRLLPPRVSLSPLSAPHRRVWLFVGELCVWVSRAFFFHRHHRRHRRFRSPQNAQGRGLERGGKGEQDAID